MEPTFTNGAGMSADWLAAWAQVGAAIGTVLTLLAALWINHRTRVALDDERLARKQDVARLDASRIAADIQSVKATAHSLIEQVRATSGEFTILTSQTGLTSGSVRGWIGLYLVEAISNLARGRNLDVAHWRALRTTLRAAMLKDLVDHGLVVSAAGR